MSLTLFKNAKLLDPTKSDLQDGVAVLVEGGRIREVSPRPIRAAGAAVVDLGGRTLMPGLIDCHVHVFLPEVRPCARPPAGSRGSPGPRRRWSTPG